MSTTDNAGAPGTKFPELFTRLGEPFPPGEVKTRSQGGTTLSYITARSAMNRLDVVLGPENWEDDYQPFGSEGVKCVLTIRLPDGTRVAKTGIGGVSKMKDAKDTAKTGESSALKRAAVKFGVARNLYRDGIPDFTPNDAHHAKNLPNKTGYGKTGAYAPPASVASYRQWLAAFVGEVNQKWLDHWTGPHGETPPKLKDLVSTFQISGHLVKWARAAGALQAPEEPRAQQTDQLAAVLWDRSRDELVAEATTYARKCWRTETAKLQPRDDDASQDQADPDCDYPDEPGSEG